MCSLSDNIYDYPFVSQGKVTVPSIDDSEEMQMADVRSFENWGQGVGGDSNQNNLIVQIILVKSNF